MTQTSQMRITSNVLRRSGDSCKSSLPAIMVKPKTYLELIHYYLFIPCPQTFFFNNLNYSLKQSGFAKQCSSKQSHCWVLKRIHFRQNGIEGGKIMSPQS